VIDAGLTALAAVRTRLAAVATGLPVLPCRLFAVGVSLAEERLAVSWLNGRRVLPFAGIGNPQRFAATLAGLAAEVVESRWFPDHHVYSEAEVDEVVERAGRLAAVAVTTEKDAVKLSTAALERIAVLGVELSPLGGDMADLLRPVLAGPANPAEERLESGP
jgi:tetraacyldisaccharide 4'-kinase